MARSRRPSRADQRIIDSLPPDCPPVSTAQLERWRRWKLIEPNVVVRRGRGVGTVTEATTATMTMAAWLARHARPGIGWDRLALRAFDENLPVPEQGIRNAFLQQIDKVRLPGGGALDPAPGADRASWALEAADAVSATGVPVFRLQARIARLDAAVHDLLAAQASWPPGHYAELDRRTDTDRTPAEITHMAVAAMLDPHNHMPGSTIADVLAALMPNGQPSPIASILQFSDLDLAEMTAGEWLGQNTAGSILDDVRTCVAEADLGELRQAYRAAQARTRRTRDLLDAVEAELATETLGDACATWLSAAAFGLPRLLLLVTARDRQPHEFAASAALLLWTDRMISRLLRAFPEGFAALEEPLRQMIEETRLAALAPQA